MPLDQRLHSLGAPLISALGRLTLPACDRINLPRIHPGVTTQAEVRQRLGEPDFVHRDKDGAPVWEYTRQPAGTTCYRVRFERNDVVSPLEQVINERTFTRIRLEMTQEQVSRLLGRPASKTVFDNLGEEIWEWHIEETPKTGEAFFMVHFNLSDNRVKKTSKRTEMRG